jgi:glycosyltransferase involved in cell wall biosynthesis
LRIALDATYSLDDQLSGVGVYSRELLEGLAREHPEVRFVWSYRAHRFRQALAVKPPPHVRRGLLQEPWAPRLADLFHGLNQRLPRVRLRHPVVTFHDLFVMTGDYSTPDFRRRFTELARQAAGEAEAIITVSAFTAGQVHELLGVDRARIHVVHHGITERPAAGMPREKVILHVGAIQHRKNIIRLVEAFEEVDPPWRLVLAGSRGYGAEEILRRVEKSKAHSRILLPGYVAAAELGNWYARASVFAFPSLDEGFGMPVLEAMAAGIPVVTSDQSALPEVAGDAALLVDPGDTSALAAALRDLTVNEELRAELAERGLRQSRRFTWATAIRRTWEVYRSLLTGSLRQLQF